MMKRASSEAARMMVLMMAILKFEVRTGDLALQVKTEMSARRQRRAICRDDKLGGAK